MLLMDNLLLASVPHRAAVASAVDPVPILLKPALPASIRGPKALHNRPKCPSLQIRRRAEWSTVKHFFVEELLEPARLSQSGRLHGVIPLLTVQVTLVLTTQADS